MRASLAVGCLLASSSSLAIASPSSLLRDDFHESLHLRPLPSGRVQSVFTFTLSSLTSPFATQPSQGDNFHLLPSSLLTLIEGSSVPVSELALSFNKGRWDYDEWGRPDFVDANGQQWGSSMVATGAEVWAKLATGHSGQMFQREQREEAFHALLSGLSGQFCSSLAAGGSREAISRASNMTSHLAFGTDDDHPHDVLHLSYPPSPCTEVVHPMLSLLPCKRSAGLTTLLDPHTWLKTEWHGVELHLKRAKHSAGSTTSPGWSLEVRASSVWRHDGHNDGREQAFSMSKLMGSELSSTCPLATSSHITLVAPTDGLNYTVQGGPNPQHVSAATPGSPEDADSEDALDASASHQLQHSGQVQWDTTTNVSSEAPSFDVSLSWRTNTSDHHRRHRPDLRIRRSLVSSNQLDGHLVLSITNDRPERSRRIAFRDVLPWYLLLDMPSAESTITPLELPMDSPYIRFESDLSSSPVRKVQYTDSIPRCRPSVLEMELVVPPRSQIQYRLRFEKETIRYEEHPSDAHRGLEVGAATAWELGLEDDDDNKNRPISTWKTDVGLIEVAVPDFSMPYNVIIFTSTIVALFAGSALNLMTRVFVDVKVPALARYSQRHRRRLKREWQSRNR